MTEKEFVNKQVYLLSEELKVFPDGFISNYESKVVSVPSKNLILGEEFFGKYEILTAEGNLVFHSTSYDEAKFIVYSSRTKPEKVLLPINSDELKKSLLAYNKYLDGLIKDISMLYKKNFPEGKNLHVITNDIFRILNLVRY
jgi:hypothetical protein